MQKALFSLIAASVVGVSAANAQIPIDPCGPTVTVPAAGNTELGNLALNVTEVGQLHVIPHPTGPAMYLGSATVKRTGATDWDPMAFEWTPGSNAVPLTDLDLASGPGDEFAIGMSRDGLHCVMDTGAGHPVGNGNPMVISRASTAVAFDNNVSAAPLTGVPGGYIDTSLGIINGVDVLFYVPAAGGLEVGDIDLDPNSATYGSVTNIRTAVNAQTTLPGYQFEHSPECQFSAAGESVALFFSVYTSSSGSDPCFQSTCEVSNFVAASTNSQLVSYPFDDDGTDWNANPLVIDGTAIYADAAGSYGDPREYQVCTLSSSQVSGSAGGTVNLVGKIPAGAAGVFIAAINLGAFQLPSPIDLSTIPGINGAGNVCVASFASASSAVSGSEFGLSLNVPAGSTPGVLLCEGAVAEINNNTVWATNISVIEIGL